LKLELAVAFGDVSPARQAAYAGALGQVKSDLEDKGVTVTLAGTDNSLTLADIIKSYAWTPGAKRAALHISDTANIGVGAGAVGSTTAAIHNKGITYIAAGVPAGAAGFADLLRNAPGAHKFDGSDINVFADELTAYLLGLAQAEQSATLFTAEDDIKYSIDYYDPAGQWTSCWQAISTAWPASRGTTA
jgi:hypothetical protein